MRQPLPSDAEQAEELIERKMIFTEKQQKYRTRSKATDVSEGNREGMKGRGGGMASMLQQLWVIKPIYTVFLLN